MICIIAGNYREALTYARGMEFDHDEWFYPTTPDDLHNKENFHVIVTGTAGQNVHPMYFERVYQLAKRRGRINRK